MDLQTRANEIAIEMIETQNHYRAKVAEYAKKGYRAPHCIHGTNCWTDYDNICYGCEEENGFSEYSTKDEIRAMARAEAIREHNQKMYRIHSAAIAIDMAIDLAREHPEHVESDTMEKITASIFQQFGI